MRLTILTTLLLTNLALAGHETGNGTESKDFLANNAWFVENRPVQYCIERDKDFIVPLNGIKQTIEVSLNKWVAAYTPFDIGFPATNKLQTKFIFNEVCNESIDLTFYFGGTPEKIKPILDKNPRHVGLAYPLSTNLSNSWTKGFIYIKDSNVFDDEEGEDIPVNDPLAEYRYVYVADWRKDNNLDAILLHEIGHVFGATHIAGTIMRESLASELWIEYQGVYISNQYKRQIDNEYSILPNIYAKSVGWNDQGVQKTITFENDKYTYKTSNETYTFYTSESVYSNVLSDMALGDHDKVFKSYILANGTGDDVFVNPGVGIEHFVMSGVIVFEGKETPAIYMKNMGGYIHQFKIFQNGKWEILVKFKN